MDKGKTGLQQWARYSNNPNASTDSGLRFSVRVQGYCMEDPKFTPIDTLSFFAVEGTEFDARVEDLSNTIYSSLKQDESESLALYDETGKAK